MENTKKRTPEEVRTAFKESMRRKKEWLEESIEKHTDDYLDWKYDKNVYLAGSEKLQNVFDKLQELKGDGSNEYK